MISRVGHDRGFWFIAFAFVVAAAFTALPTPLYPLYQQREELSTFAITVVYAVYAVGVVGSLVFAGHVSDWFGRRRVIAGGLIAEVLAAVVFVGWPSFPGLLVGRVISGVGIGVVTATAAAHLTELHLAARPGQGRRRSDLVAAGASMAGFALGPPLSGVLAEYVGWPLGTPYVVFGVLLLVAAGGVLLAPETVYAAAVRPVYRPQRIVVPNRDRGRYFAAAGAGFVVLAVLGLFASLAPIFVAGTMHRPSRFLAGSIVGLVMATALLFQVLMDRVPGHGQLTAGLTLVVFGISAVAGSVFVPSLAMFVLGGVATGAGSGPLLKGALSTVVEVAPPPARAETLAGFYLAGYLGLATPVLGLGFAARFVSREVALLMFVVVMVTVTAIVGPRLLSVSAGRRG